MVFDVDKIESFCVISFVPEQKCNISPDGGQFVSTSDNRVQVNFPPHAVNKTDEIVFKVLISITLFCASFNLYWEVYYNVTNILHNYIYVYIIMQLFVSIVLIEW